MCVLVVVVVVGGGGQQLLNEMASLANQPLPSQRSSIRPRSPLKSSLLHMWAALPQIDAKRGESAISRHQQCSWC